MLDIRAIRRGAYLPAAKSLLGTPPHNRKWEQDERYSHLRCYSEHDWVLSGARNYYGRAMRSACRQAGFEPRVAHEVDEQPTALAIVAAGLGITLMSDLGRPFLPAAGVDVLELTQNVRRQLLVAYDQATHSRPAISAFLRSARRMASTAGLTHPRRG